MGNGKLLSVTRIENGRRPVKSTGGEKPESVLRDNCRPPLARELLRRRYRPDEVRLLFVGESPPASGRFFYQADSGLYRAIRDTFFAAFPVLDKTDFLESFRDLGCYLIDLCQMPVDRFSGEQRRKACSDGEGGLAQTLKRLRPNITITVVRSIAANVRRAQQKADWRGTHLELPYPGRWQHHRTAFEQALTPVLRGELSKDEVFERLQKN
jgi:hypothetical protein